MRSLQLLALAALAAGAYANPVEAVTYADAPGKAYVPIREMGRAVGWYVHWDEATNEILMDEKPVSRKTLRKLFDGTNMVEIGTLENLGADVEGDAKDGWKITTHQAEIQVTVPKKEVEISLDSQELRAWQGNRLVMRTNISSGAGGSTPRGSWTAGPIKHRMHYSSLYNNSPMPFSVQVHGNIFIHGYKSVPKYPASHGCIRMPLTGMNAARYFFDWVDVGVPVRIVRGWTEAAARFNEESDAGSDD